MNCFTALAALAAAVVFSSSSFTFAQAPEKKDVHISVGGKAAFYYLPLTIAEQLGYFKDEGLNVKISDFAGGSQALQHCNRRLCRPKSTGAQFRTACRDKVLGGD